MADSCDIWKPNTDYCKVISKNKIKKEKHQYIISHRLKKTTF